MGIAVTLRGGSGDMSKSTYDPNLDGIIAKAEIDTSIHGDMEKSTYDTDNDGVVDTVEEIEHDQIKKIKSDVLKASHSSAANFDCDPPNGTTYLEVKRMTFNSGLRGAIRVKWCSQNVQSSVAVRGYSKLVDKDGTIIGSEHDNGNNNTTVHTYTEDIDTANFVAADYIAVQVKNSDNIVNKDIETTNLMIYYDENDKDFTNG